MLYTCSITLQEEINGMALNALFITAFFGTEVCFYVAEVAFDMQINQDGQYRVFLFRAFQSFHSGTPLLSASLAPGFLLYLVSYHCPFGTNSLAKTFSEFDLSSTVSSFPFQKILRQSLYSDILFPISSCSQML